MKKQINIEGMSCEHCVKHVTNALLELEGVKDIAVDLAGKKATAEFTKDTTDADIQAVIEDAGYDVISITSL